MSVRFDTSRLHQTSQLLPCALLAAALAGCSAGPQAATPPAFNAALDGHGAAPAVMHNAWSQRVNMPTPRLAPGAVAVGTKIYVIGGYNGGGVLSVNEIFNTVTKTWSTGKPMPTPRWSLGVAAVNGIVYAVGGIVDLSHETDVVEAYDPAHDSWSIKRPMPTARGSLSVAATGGFVYAIGGYLSGSNRLATVDRYDPVADKWSTEAPLLTAKSGIGIGVLGKTIIAASGLSDSGITGDNEAYNATRNAWRIRRAEPNVRNAPCSWVIGKKLYTAGGADAAGAPLGSLDIYGIPTNAWSTGAAMIQTTIGPGAAAVNGILYCFGGASQGFPSFSTTFYVIVQAYRP
jgi:hypothetical protein